MPQVRLWRALTRERARAVGSLRIAVVPPLGIEDSPRRVRVMEARLPLHISLSMPEM